MQAEERRRGAAAEIFLILAEFFKYPDEEFVAQVCAGEVDTFLSALCEQAGYRLARTDFQDRSAPYPEIKAEYSRCFLGIGRAAALPVESLYKAWTADTTSQLSIAASKGYLMGDAAAHILYLLDQYSMKLPQEYESMPDHLTLILELLAFIIRQRPVTEQITFIRDHLDWLDDLLPALTAVADKPLYPYVIKVIQAAAREEQRISRLEQTGRDSAASL